MNKGGKPKGKEKGLIKERNRLIKLCLKKGYSQSEASYIFRLPRNTISVVNKL